MCGIAGILTRRPRSSEELRRMALKMSGAIRHRGPDGDGVWVDAESGIAVSHRRLSIVDLSTNGSQPMVSSCGTMVMVYNGEIYNTDELRDDLIAIGTVFNGSSDTEVILEGFVRWGVRQTTEKLIGMFALAVWDRRDQSLTMVRDRLGIKPLYWSNNSGNIIFGSELKALRQHPDCPRELNRNAIAGYIRNCYINNPSTIFQGVQQLQPGWIMRCKLNASKPVFEQYWSLKEVVSTGRSSQFSGSDSEAVAELNALLSDAVSRRMVADVPLGAFLSGGVDSSAVTALMQKASATPIKTFSIGFNEEGYNESEHASAVAKHLKTDHTELFVTAEDALKVIPELPAIYDEPFADASQIPTFLLSKLTREHVTVALSGDGGDELFAGYERYFTAYKMRQLIRQPELLRKLQASSIERLSPEVIKKLSTFLPESVSYKLRGGKYKRLVPLLREGTMRGIYRRLQSHSEHPADILTGGVEPEYKAWEDSDLDFDGDFYGLMQYTDTLDYLPDDILTKIDRASMATSLEARVPILDHRVAEYSWTLPTKMKVRDGKGKWILRQLLYQYVPPSIIDRPKKGFAVPVGIWLKGPLREWAEDLLSENSLKQTGIFKAEPIRRTWQEHLAGDANREFHLWDILSLQSWAISNGIG